MFPYRVLSIPRFKSKQQVFQLFWKMLRRQIYDCCCPLPAPDWSCDYYWSAGIPLSLWAHRPIGCWVDQLGWLWLMGC